MFLRFTALLDECLCTQALLIIVWRETSRADNTAIYMDGNTSFFFKAGFYLNSFSLLQLHVSLVRPHLEYACAMWDPHTKRHLKLLEGVQKFALRVCFKQYSGSHEDYYLGQIYQH